MWKSATRMLTIFLAAFGIAIMSMAAWATPFQFTYRTTIAVSTITGINNGDEVVVSVLADNGGTTPISAVWNEADLISATLTAGSYIADYGAPLTAGLDPAFRTDAFGILERAGFLGGLLGLNSDSFGVGGGAYLFDDAFLDFYGRPAVMDVPLSEGRLDLWSGPTAAYTSVPEPATHLLLVLGLLLGIAVRRRPIDELPTAETTTA